jgi:Protein of unknown function (DUF1553)/Protein of unknown function (DUF1549)/Planctomycete cytochrome C
VAALQSVAQAQTPEQFFETKIRPLLLERCVGCHSDSNPDGGLSLESRSGWVDRKVIVPGSPTSSLLIKAVRHLEPDLQMPPPDSEQKPLSEAEIRLLEQWIAQGAVDPRVETISMAGPRRRAREFEITEEDLQHWAYQPLRGRQQLNIEHPDTQPAHLVIDSLIDSQLAQQGLQANPLATPRELVRRAYFDLWGLPPEPAVVAAFAANPTEKAWSGLIDRLLSSHHYGERWGRYWLDCVRYADTNGYERDGVKPSAWRYRDYVITSFNQDKPYDLFITEQLAGDLLIEAEQLSHADTPQRWQDAIIATGFYRLHVWDDEPDSTDAAELDDLDDNLVTLGAAIIGQTIGCARCHDHKFDPLSQVDYYSLLELLRDIDPYGQSKRGGGGRGTGNIERYLVGNDQLERWQKQQADKIEGLKQQLAQLDGNDAALTQESTKQQLQASLKQLMDSQPPFDKALAINSPNQRKPTFVLQRGDYQTPGAQVGPSIPQIYRHEKLLRLANQPVVANRLDLAKWLTSDQHPLTARVLVNRVWLGHFGAGIVPTPDDFGYTGQPPSHPGLLDFLATELIADQWSIKSLHRKIMLSQAYRRSSVNTAGNNQAIDADNRGLWRQNLRRLDAEAIRDGMLAYAGQLSDMRNGPGVYSELSNEIRETANPVSLSGWHTSPAGQWHCRSVFLVVKRSLKDPLLESFDFSNSHSPVGKRVVTTVAPQALMLLNDALVRRQSEQLAQRVLGATEARQPALQTSDIQGYLNELWQIVLQRDPSADEVQSIQQFIDAQNVATAGDEVPNRQLKLWTQLCKIVLNSNECLYVD